MLHEARVVVFSGLNSKKKILSSGYNWLKEEYCINLDKLNSYVMGNLRDQVFVWIRYGVFTWILLDGYG